MAGLRLQIFGQYQALLRNFCERSQSVSPRWIVYWCASEGVTITGGWCTGGALSGFGAAGIELRSPGVAVCALAGSG
jgi:hypothetical protein